ncbi:MAG TPA: hypothetical protein VEX43_16385 [Chthoniobacterales bacterium]|nr:hypothetical protein [Chthoniobacterales bacterium]
MARQGLSDAVSLAVMKQQTLYVSAILLLAGATAARSNQSDSQCHGLDQRVVGLISQYKELRERRRQLPDGTYDKELRDHGGKLHKILQSLGTELGHPPHTKNIIVGCLGEPDSVRNDVQMARYLEIYERERRRTGRAPRAKRDREYLIYHWRGGHDFMFFINEDGLIVDHGWWFAYE